MIIHACSHIIESIKQVEEKRQNARQASHFIAFMATG